MGGTLVGVAAGLVAVAGCFVAVGSTAALLAVLDEGSSVEAGFGSSDEAFAALVEAAVGEGIGCAASVAARSAAASRSRGAPGGGFRAPVADAAEPPPRSAAVVVSTAFSPPPRPSAVRPTAMVKKPPATKAIEMALGLIRALLVPRFRWFPGGLFLAASRGLLRVSRRSVAAS